jgi:carboxylesterase
LKVYKSEKDETADPVSAVLIYKGLKTAEDNRIDVEMIDSELHVFTRLDLRTSVSQKDRDNQRRVFDEILGRVK